METAGLGPEKGMSGEEIERRIDAILAEATLEEKVGMMSGQGFYRQFRESGKKWGAHAYRAGGGIERLGVPAMFFTDGPRGVARGQSTCFPCTMARGASFDTDLEARIGEAMGIEARAQGATLSGAVCINLLRHPAWGRAQECYGEDSHLLGEMGAALATGIQAHNVAATVKHFALNSMENARFKVDVRVDERTLHEVYLPHFRRVVEAGVATVMSAYNKVNGEYCGQNRALLTDILRGEWGFAGFVHSDWVFGVYQVYGAAAGLDVENPEPAVFGQKLEEAARAGMVEPQVIDTACRRILRVIYGFACAEDPLPDYPQSLVCSTAHRGLALEAARKSAVLLENDGTLPLSGAGLSRLAVLGKLASLENTGDMGSSRVRPPYVITPLEGLRRKLGTAVVVTADEDDLEAAAKVAADADASVVVVGYTADDEGEFIPGDISLGQEGAGDGGAKAPARSRGGDRDQLGLKPAHVALIEAAAAAGKPVIVVIVAGSAVLTEDWREKASAILQTFYAGMEGGTALAELLLGELSPSGRLPFTVARSASDYPPFDRDADTTDYEYWHGYALFDRQDVEPRYPFGHGLSYVPFSLRALKVRQVGNALEVSVAVTNEGALAADEIVQCYIGCPGVSVPRPVRTLKAFARVSLRPGETKMVRMTVTLDSLAWRDARAHAWRFEHGRYTVMVGRSSRDEGALVLPVDL